MADVFSSLGRFPHSPGHLRAHPALPLHEMGYMGGASRHIRFVAPAQPLASWGFQGSWLVRRVPGRRCYTASARGRNRLRSLLASILRYIDQPNCS